MSNSATKQAVDDFLQTGDPPLGPEFDCPYLRGRKAQFRCFVADDLRPEIYHAMMDRGFRRSGNIFYRPSCPHCSQCRQLRVPVQAFKASKSQRRIQRLNRDITINVQSPALTREKWRLYARYLRHQHDGTMSDDFDDLRRFLYCSSVTTIEIEYFLQERLLGVSIADQSSEALSSVYMYFDPDFAHRSLGIYSALREIEYCRKSGRPYYYLGFYINNCSKMDYKAGFRPYEVLDSEHNWVRSTAAGD